MQTKIEVAENDEATLVTITMGDKEATINVDQALRPMSVDIDAEGMAEQLSSTIVNQANQILDLERQLQDARVGATSREDDLARALTEEQHVANGLREMKDAAESRMRVLQDEFDGLKDHADGLATTNYQLRTELEAANRRVEEYKRWQKSRSDTYREQEKLGSRYVFSEIPVADYKSFVRILNLYFNSDRYVMRVRGQHVKKEGLTESQRRMAHNGHALEHCTHARIYIDEKVPNW